MTVKPRSPGLAMAQPSEPPCSIADVKPSPQAGHADQVGQGENIANDDHVSVDVFTAVLDVLRRKHGGDRRVSQDDINWFIGSIGCVERRWLGLAKV